MENLGMIHSLKHMIGDENVRTPVGDGTLLEQRRGEKMDDGLSTVIELETRDLYKTPGERAAYRAGMSTAAMICDSVARKFDNPVRMSKTQRMAKNAASACGDDIMRLRELVKVNEPRGLSAAEGPVGRRVNT